MKRYVFFIVLLFASAAACAQDTLTIYEHDTRFINNNYFYQLEDPNGNLKIENLIKNGGFHKTDDVLPENTFNAEVLWLKVILHNKTTQPYIPITIQSSIVDNFDLYFKGSNSHRIIHLSSTFPHINYNQVEQSITHINCIVLPDSTRTIYLRVKSTAGAVLPIQADAANQFMADFGIQNIVLGAFGGIVAIMALYNLCLWLIVKDRSYLYYVFYVLMLGLTQMLQKGYGTNFISSDKTVINNYVIPVCRLLFACSILLFVYEFLHIKSKSSALRKFYKLLFALYLLPLISVIIGWPHIAYTLITINLLITSVALLTIGARLYFSGFEPAKFFLIGWTLFFSSLILSIVRNAGILPYNAVTFNLVIYASVVELILFSTALADKINFYRQQKDESQRAALIIATENERLITEQNIKLETMVSERTGELIALNVDLQQSIERQKAAQAQLVDAEKMASLGQLTAGIAHEINNPINFVSANVEPLKIDLQELFTLLDKYDNLGQSPADEALLEEIKNYRNKIDPAYLKGELKGIIDGIAEGAARTKEIVESLATFSRTDELILVPADINKTILSSLVILRSTTPAYISVTPVLNYLPIINCYPGKLGQVFVNIVTNSIQAIKAKPVHTNENIAITTINEDDHIKITIADTGGGISADVKQHIFEPFFTTKGVGEGTGLGLSIVFGIVEKHAGTITVDTQAGMGTTITLKLPKNLQ